jgi:hypothetical protein
MRASKVQAKVCAPDNPTEVLKGKGYIPRLGCLRFLLANNWLQATMLVQLGLVGELPCVS